MRSKGFRTFTIVMGAGLAGALIGATYMLLLGPGSMRNGFGFVGLALLTGLIAPFTILGSALLAMAHAAIGRRGPPVLAGAALLLVGPLLGAAMLLGFIASLGAPFSVWNVVWMGAGVGLLTTIWWLLFYWWCVRRDEGGAAL